MTELQLALLEQRLAALQNLAQLEGVFEDVLLTSDYATFQRRLDERIAAQKDGDNKAVG
jgi:hypothetical protein